MFFQGKVDRSDVMKWGILAGLFEGLYIGLATILYAERSLLDAMSTGWPHLASFVLISLIVISGIVTSVIVFAHPMYSCLQQKYREGVLTLALTVLTIIAVVGFALFTYQKIYGGGLYLN